MTKTECLSRAEAAKQAQEKAIERAALYTVSFGGSSELATKAADEVSRLYKAERAWLDLAKTHPKTRDAMIRKGDLPVWMFGV